jgi:hypothetical protein
MQQNQRLTYGTDSLFDTEKEFLATRIICTNPTIHFTEKHDQVSKKRILKHFGLFITGLQSLGLIEHDGDWDPYILIQLNDGTIIQSAIGYPDLLINESEDNFLLRIYLYLQECYSYGFLSYQEIEEFENDLMVIPLEKKPTEDILKMKQAMDKNLTFLEPNPEPNGDNWNRILTIPIDHIKSIMVTGLW